MPAVEFSGGGIYAVLFAKIGNYRFPHKQKAPVGSFLF